MEGEKRPHHNAFILCKERTKDNTRGCDRT